MDLSGSVFCWSCFEKITHVVSSAKDIKDVFITFVGKSLAVKVIYVEFLI